MIANICDPYDLLWHRKTLIAFGALYTKYQASSYLRTRTHARETHVSTHACVHAHMHSYKHSGMHAHKHTRTHELPLAHACMHASTRRQWCSSDSIIVAA